VRDALPDEGLGQQIERELQGQRIAEQRRDVLEDDPGLGEVDNGAQLGAQ
jgi:hypothetical protein